MSLNWDTRNCNITDDMREEEETLTKSGTMERLLTDHMADVRDSLIWHLMFTGTTGFSNEAELDKFYMRYVRLSAVQGIPSSKVFLKYVDVAKWMGITTNVSSTTDAAFSKKLRLLLEEYSEGALKAEKLGKK